MAIQVLKFQITSEAPLLLHNGQLADPLNPWAKKLKEISGKRNKTDADYEAMAKIEWFASLYSEKGKVVLPSEVIEAAFNTGARKMKLGKQAQSTIFCTGNVPLAFDGDTMTFDELFERDANRMTVGVRVGQAKVMRTRFRVDQWACSPEIQFDDKVLNPSQVIDIAKVTGELIGLCDWRPKFGRFNAQKI